ncbi:Prophage CP4-57 regulatory protein (AlpA) [compost metagenome]
MLDFNIPHYPAGFFCKRYAVSRTTWWRLSSRPGFPLPIRIGRAVRWNASEIEAYLIQHKAY